MRRVQLWDLASGRRTGEALREPEGGATFSLAFSPDGRLLAAGTLSGKFVLWDVEAEVPLGDPIGGGSSRIAAVAFADDGRHISTLRGDGVLSVWDVKYWADGRALVRRACTLVGRNLTRSEWRRFLPDESYRRTCSQWPAGT